MRTAGGRESQFSNPDLRGYGKHHNPKQPMSKHSHSEMQCLPDVTSTIKFENLYGRPPGTPKSMKINEIVEKDMIKISGDVFVYCKQTPAGVHLATKGL